MNIATLAKTTGGVLLTATLGGLASRPAKSDWYETLRKPGFQPPRQAFPIVWPVLYADIAAVAAAALTVSSADLTRRAVQTRGPGAGVLGLYPLWCAFATLLSSRIWWLNR
jgi:tryptophan-rich sensory protein